MPKKAKDLSALEVKRLTDTKMNAVGNVAGLMLDIKESGAKAWILRTTIGTRRSDFGLGGYPEVSLAAAIEAAKQIKAKIKDGIDPAAERRAKQAIVEWSFKRCAEAYITGHRAEWTNAKHADQWTNTLATYVFPRFGHKHVRDVDVPDVLSAIEPDWTTKNETMVRVRNRIELVLSWATARGYRPKGFNPATWRGNLDQVLAKPSKVNNRESHPAVQIDEVHALLKHLRTIKGSAARCLEFTTLTAARSGNAREATWAQIDTKAAVWTVQDVDMKAGRLQRVPLCAQALALLEQLPKFASTDLLFPGRDGKKPLSDMALTQIMRRMTFKDKDGRQAVPHGLRSTFMDWAAERTAYPEDVREMALAHAIGNDTVGAYRRGDLFEKRRHLMSDWANFIEAPPVTGDNVVLFKAA